MASVVEKDDRVLLPSTSPKEVLGTCKNQMREMCETLILRVWTAPKHIYYESDDLWHVLADGQAALEKSIVALKKQLLCDTFKLDDLKFLGVPAMGNVTPRVLLMESYIWVSLCMLGYMLGVIIGALGPLKATFGQIFHPINALVMAIIVPFWVHARLRKYVLADDEQRRICFYNSVLMGVLLSYGAGMPPIPFAQFVALFPLWIGMVSALHEIYPLHRLIYLAVAIGAPYALNVWYMMKTVAPKCTRLNLHAWTGFCAIAAVDLQLKLGRLQRRWAGKELEQWDTAVVLIVSHFLLSRFVSTCTLK